MVMQAGDGVDVTHHQTLAGVLTGVAHVQVGEEGVSSARTEAAVLEARAVVDRTAPGVAGNDL